VFGKAIWDPVQLMGKFHSPLLSILALVTLAVATLTTNIAANVVSPANDFSNFAPRLISFRTGGLITGVIGILMFPWKLYADPSGYIFAWLIGYSALLGPIAGIMIADYFVYRKRQLDVAELYKPRGEYTYSGGFSVVALLTLAVSVLPNIPGFLVTIRILPPASVSPLLQSIYHYAWFVGFVIAFVVYLLLRRMSKT
jgi:NCS1 family nucleobase:cation symporter-1